MPESNTLYCFVETPIFTKRITVLASSQTLETIQAELVEDPERWPMVKGLHGARKGRVADPKVTPREERQFPFYLSLPATCRPYSFAVSIC